VIEPTDEMRQAFREAAEGLCTCAVCLNHRLAAVLAIVEREHVILPRGAQPLCCGDHPEAVIRWGECPVCVAETPPEERT